jgi:hypothetical protein
VTTFSPELQRIETTRCRVAGTKADRYRRRRRTRRLTLSTLLIALLALSSAALAGVQPLADLIPGFSVAETPPTPSADVTAAINPLSTRTPDATLAELQAFGVDTTQLHRARSPRLSVTVFIAPRTTGGICVVYAQVGVSVTQCGDEATIESGGWISAKDGTHIYVGLRPDGTTHVTAEDGTTVPVVDNVFISDKPIKP